MKLIILSNPSESNITNFPIAEPELVNNEVKYDSNGSIKSTGKTLLWSLEAGVKKAFPEYVAKELLKVYEFLKEEVEETEEVKEEATAKVGGQLVCKHCGQGFEKVKGLALHIAIKHPEKL